MGKRAKLFFRYRIFWKEKTNLQWSTLSRNWIKKIHFVRGGEVFLGKISNFGCFWALLSRSKVYHICLSVFVCVSLRCFFFRVARPSLDKHFSTNTERSKQSGSDFLLIVLTWTLIKNILLLLLFISQFFF